MNRTLQRLMLVFAVLSLIAGPVLADHCSRRVRFRSVHARNFVQPFYQVGSALREEAIAQRAAERALEAFTLRLKTQLQETGTSTPASATLKQVGAVFRKSCLRCHTGADADGGLDLSDPAALSEAQRMKVALWTHQELMPPPGQGERVSDEKASLLMRWAVGE